MSADRLSPGDLATVEEEHDAGYSTTHVVVCEARRGPEDYWFIQYGYNGLEATTPFDRVTFEYRSDQPDVIRTIKFFRVHRGTPIETGSVEGGRASWGDDVVDALERVNREAD